MVAHRGLALGRGDEVGRDQLGALVDQLVEGVLAVGAGLAPDHRPGLVVDPLPVAADALAVALHVALLEVGGKAVQVLIVGQDRLRRGIQEVAVPDAEQRQQHRQVGSSGAVRKCSSIAWAPASSSSKRSKPIASTIGRPIADQSE